MEFGYLRRSTGLGLGLMLAVALAAVTVSRSQQATPHQGNISITGVPHAGPGGPGPTEPISGRVRGIDFATHKVVVYVFAGDRWWVQPTVANPLTDIGADGNWETDTHLGGSYAALLVKQSFKPSATIDTLPGVQGDVVAVARIAGLR